MAVMISRVFARLSAVSDVQRVCLEGNGGIPKGRQYRSKAMGGVGVPNMG